MASVVDQDDDDDADDSSNRCPPAPPPLLVVVDQPETPDQPAAIKKQDIDQFISSSRDESNATCKICGKAFSRSGLLRLHMNVHSLTQQSTRRHEVKCAECCSSFRSKALLQKHVSFAHPARQPSAAAADDPPPTTVAGPCQPAAVKLEMDDQQKTGEQPPPSQQHRQQPNPRPFVCNDCDIAFRIHGHLAKHLRSKLHIMKLECVGKLPTGTYGTIEQTDVRLLQEIDTRTVDTSLCSLLALVQRLQPSGQPSPPPPPPPVVKDDDNPSDSDDLLIDVEGGCSPVKQVAAAAVANCPTTSWCANVPPVMTPSPVSRSVVAGVWTPPVLDNKPPTAAAVQPAAADQKCRPAASAATQTKLPRRLAKPAAAAAALPSTLTNTDSTPPAATAVYCQLCALAFGNSVQLNIHRLSDHLVMMDGHDFRCPFQRCERVYPNRDCFKQHLAAHFAGRVPATSSDPVVGDEGDAAAVSPSQAKRRRGGRRGAAPPAVAPTVQQETCCPLMVNACSLAAGSSNSDSEASYLSINNASPAATATTSSPNQKQRPGGDAVAASCCPVTNSSSSPPPPATCSSGNQTAGCCLSDASLSSFSHPPSNNSFVPWNNAAALLNSHTPISAQSSPMLAANGGRPPADSSLLALAAAASNPALISYQNLCQQFAAAASLLSAVQHAQQCGAVTPALLAALSSTAAVNYQQQQQQQRQFQMAPLSLANGLATGAAAGGLFATTAPPPTCLICGKQYATFAEYQEHVLSHSQPRPFLCETCDAGFPTAQALHAHQPCKQQQQH